MIVEAGAGHLCGKRRAQAGEVRRRTGGELDDDHARYRQFAQRETGAEPRFDELFGLLFGVGSHIGNAGRAARDRDRRAHVGLDIAAGNRPDLDGDFASDGRLPIARGADHHHHGSGRQRGEECHDGDDGRQRTSRRSSRSARSVSASRCARTWDDAGCAVVPRLRHGLDRLNRRHADVPRAGPDGGASYSSISAISWVAMTTDVPDLLSSMNSRSRRWPRLGSTLPVGSSASRSCGRAITARAIAARCFSPPESTGGRDAHALAETHPLQQFDDLGAVGGLVLAEHAQRQRHILVSGQVVEQPEILKDDADAAAQRRAAVLAQRRGVVVEHGDQAARRLERQEQHAQQRGLAGARWPGEELEGVALDAEAEVAQNLRAEPIAQADILESDHAVLR